MVAPNRGGGHPHRPQLAQRRRCRGVGPPPRVEETVAQPGIEPDQQVRAEVGAGREDLRGVAGQMAGVERRPHGGLAQGGQQRAEGRLGRSGAAVARVLLVLRRFQRTGLLAQPVESFREPGEPVRHLLVTARQFLCLVGRR
ncbi:hypothetical protein [Streptomyces sp. NPDC058644]|uniref:hypothetical protein n=1 Tax=unclassified Streptomyces TaxID=2593676 RepID=UPI00365E35A1